MNVRAGDTAQWLRAFVLREDPGLIPSTYTRYSQPPLTPVSGDSMQNTIHIKEVDET